MFSYVPRWWGGSWHAVYTVAVFVVLASLDNMALGLIPPLYPVMARDLGVGEGALGVVTGVSILLTAITAVVWGYWGDRTGRKRLLLAGTVVWAGSIALSGAAGSYWTLFGAQIVASVGLGCIASVGFSVISDFIAPGRRGLVMSLWGLSQGAGTMLGSLMAGMVGASNWRLPFYLMAALGALFSVLYLFTFDPKRGRSEPELKEAFDQGLDYEYRMEARDFLPLLTKRSNLWLILQGFSAQFAFGSMIWLSRLMIAKVEAEGYSLETATVVGSLFGALFTLGGLFSILGGYLGDLWQRRDGGGRAKLAAIGILGSIPLYVALFFLPLKGLVIPEGAGSGAITAAVLSSVFTNGYVAVAFLLALGAQAFSGSNFPNWLALLTDVNLPEHRGSVYALGNLSNGFGRALGNGLTGAAFTFFAASFLAPWNYVWALVVFQVFFIPTGICYWLASRTAPGDIARVRQAFTERVQQPAAPAD